MNNLFIIIVILLVTLVVIYVIKNLTKENFDNYGMINNTNIHSIILDNQEKDDIKDSVNNYLGTFNKSANNSNLSLGKLIFNSYSLESNNWTLSKSDVLNINNKTIVLDLHYDKMRHLMAVGLYYDESGNPKYDIYRKVENDIKSSWEKITVNPNIQIQSLCYDNQTSKLLAINSVDGQIYESKFFDNYDEWVGPINFDMPMKKIMYDNNNYLIGIGKENGYIYKKEDLNWRKSNWNQTKINKTSVHDLIYDVDGCLIATSSKGILKQLYPDFVSEFVDIREHHLKHKEILSKVDILKYKVGFEFLDEIFNNSRLGKHLKKIYDIKKLTIDLCNSKKFNKNFKVNTDLSHEISIKNREISDLYEKIDEIQRKIE